MKSTEESAGERYPLHLACVHCVGWLGIDGGTGWLEGKVAFDSRACPAVEAIIFASCWRAFFYFVECKSLLVDYCPYSLFSFSVFLASTLHRWGSRSGSGKG